MNDWTAEYDNMRTLATGEVAATRRMLFTCALFVGLDAVGYKRRFCFHAEAEAADSLAAWDGAGDPPGNWIKEKPSDRRNPNYRDLAMT